MTLDEVIQILERKIDTCLKLIKQLENDDSISAVMHLENESQRYEEYHLLVEWLKELKAYKDEDKEFWNKRTKNTIQGKWLETEERETYIGADWDADPVVPRKYRLPLCSICGEEFGIAAFNYNFCPNCGTRMKGVDDGK